MTGTPDTSVTPHYTMAEALKRIEGLGFAVSARGHDVRVDAMKDFSHAISAARGWWSNPDGSPKPLNIGERIALMHSELSEALEAIRTDVQSEKIPGYTGEEEEFADLLHRIFDYADARGLRLGEAYVAKGHYNLRRLDHDLATRQQAGGKKF